MRPDAQQALTSLLQILSAPAAFMVAAGLYFLYRGRQSGDEDSLRLGRMLLMFGIVMLAITGVLLAFLNGKLI